MEQKKGINTSAGLGNSRIQPMNACYLGSVNCLGCSTMLAVLYLCSTIFKYTHKLYTSRTMSWPYIRADRKRCQAVNAWIFQEQSPQGLELGHDKSILYHDQPAHSKQRQNSSKVDRVLEYLHHSPMSRLAHHNRFCQFLFRNSWLPLPIILLFPRSLYCTNSLLRHKVHRASTPAGSSHSTAI